MVRGPRNSYKKALIDTRSIPPLTGESFEHSSHPLVTYVLTQYQSAGYRAITSTDGHEPE
jgi:hypothetical protein